MQLELLNLQQNDPHFNAVAWTTECLNALGVNYGPAWPDSFGSALRSWLITAQHAPIKTLSLFSGGGGLDIGFHDAGFEIVEMVELEPVFAATLAANTGTDKPLGSAVVRCIDIRDYQPADHLKVDFIIGGPPCQTFSAAGRRAAGVQGTDDPRGTLFEEYVRILKRLNPRGFLFENVYGITGANGGKPWQDIQDAFRASGYRLFWRVLDAADYGVPQHRERLIIVGVKDEQVSFLFPSPTHGPDAQGATEYYTAGLAVANAGIDDGSNLSINGRWGHLINEIPPGLNYSFYTAEMGHPNPVFAWRSKFSDFMYKADPESPVRTIKAQGGLYTGPFSWENRHFSVAELKRLQTFPDSYVVVGKRQAQIHQLGNSVPPQFARMLALSVLNQMFGVSLPFPMKYLSATKTLGFRTRKRSLTEHYARKARQAITQLSPKTANIPLTSCERVAYLTCHFDLVDRKQQSAQAFYIDRWCEGRSLHVTCRSEPLSSPAGFSLELKPAAEGWAAEADRMIVSGTELTPECFTASWKALENALREAFRIDDLVQLNGYYQYRPKVCATLRFKGNAQVTEQWKLLMLVVSGIGVARQLSLSDIARRWEVEEAVALKHLHFLRAIGYEVRNNKTNPQITPGDFLVPYVFPTLSSRSVQLRKHL
jgi:DNA (cytosine-5)-methyltransferase 1